MRINVTGIFVSDQGKALKFYTEVFGFVMKTDIPVGEYRWLTVVPPDGPDGIELLLEPLGFPPAAVYQRTLYDAGIPLTSFGVDNMDEYFQRLKILGVKFTAELTQMGPAIVATFDDTCGNLIQMVQS